MCPKLLLFWWIKSLRFLVQSCKYDFKNQKRTSNVQFFGLSKFLLFKNVPPLNLVVKHYKLKNSILLIYLNDIHHHPPPYYSDPATPTLHSYLLGNNQKVALPASLIKNGAFTLSLLEDRQYQYYSAKIGDYYQGRAFLIITLFCFGNQSLPVLAILSHFSSKFMKYSYSYITYTLIWSDKNNWAGRITHRVEGLLIQGL